MVLKNKDKTQKSESRKKIEADNKAIEILLEEKKIENNICFIETKKMSDEDRKEQRENEKPHKL